MSLWQQVVKLQCSVNDVDVDLMTVTFDSAALADEIRNADPATTRLEVRLMRQVKA